MYRTVVGSVVAAALAACASTPATHAPATTAPSPDTRSSAPEVRCRSRHTEEIASKTVAMVESDPWLLQGRATSEMLLLRRTVVQIADHFFDPHRIDPPRLLDAMLAAVVSHSGGALRREGDALVTPTGRRWSPQPPLSIWTLPLIARDLQVFLLGQFDQDQRLDRGAFAEVVMTNALLQSLDPNSVLLTPAAYRALRGESSPLAEAARAALAPPPGLPQLGGEALARMRREGIVYFRAGILVKAFVDDIRRVSSGPVPAGSFGVILDLRGSFGGPLDAVVELADLFLESGPIVTLKTPKTSEVRSARGDGSSTERVKLVVLVDSATSAGAEIVAGALRFGGRALLVGESTAGSGTVEVIYDLKDATTKEVSALKLAIAEALLPGDRGFDGIGLAPDLRVVSGPSQPRAAGCAPLGDGVGAIRTGDPDAPVLLAVDILTRAASASRSNLLEVARALVEARRQLSP